MRLSDGKNYLMVFDFVDNASQYNAPYSLHRLFKLKEYHAGAIVLGKAGQREADNELYRTGEKPEALVDYPVDAMDYELVDIFNWQEEAEGMISQMEFVRRVDVQPETIERYVREGKLVPDLAVPMSEHRVFKYFKEESLERYAREYGWTLIVPENRKAIFMDMVRTMEMSYSYKPVLLRAVLRYADRRGRVSLDDIVHFFRQYYQDRRERGLPVEKQRCVYQNPDATDREILRNILSNPFRRFECMGMMHHTKTLGIVQVDETVWKHLSDEEKEEIDRICGEKLDAYYEKLK